MAAIYIRDLMLRCVIGVFPEERDVLQDVCLNLRLEADVSRAAQTDALEDTVDYKALTKHIITLVENSRFHLIETLAERVLDLCLEDPRVRVATLTVDKPGALRFARSVAVEFTRAR